MHFLTLEMKQPTSKKEPIPLGYKHGDPKKHISSNVNALGVTYWATEYSLEFETFRLGVFVEGHCRSFL